MLACGLRGLSKASLNKMSQKYQNYLKSIIQLTQKTTMRTNRVLLSQNRAKIKHIQKVILMFVVVRMFLIKIHLGLIKAKKTPIVLKFHSVPM